MRPAPMRVDAFIQMEQRHAAAPPSRIPLGVEWTVVRLERLFAHRPSQGALLARAEKVLSFEANHAGLNDATLHRLLLEKKALFRLRRETEDDRIITMSLLREVAFRVTGMRPYREQIAGALGIFERAIVEMATGEGKTLTAALAAAAQSFRGKGCHVLTSNDYLAARDAETMAGFFDALHVSWGAITQDTPQAERRSAYARDITYLTSKEVVADFLRDRLALGALDDPTKALARTAYGRQLPLTVQRGLYCAIVDEADSVLCDGGATPLIISVPGKNAPDAAQYLAASALADTLRPVRDYRTNLDFREVQLTDSGRRLLAAHVRAQRWARPGRAEELLVQALEAREFFHESVQYIVRDGKVVIVDEPTGRIMPDHEWRDGLHQAVSAKEGLEVAPPKVTSAQSTFQDFFRRYPVMGGMTGTGWEARREFLQFYDLHVVKIPTHRPVLRRVTRRVLYPDEAAKVRDIARIVAERQQAGQPVLIGTASIEASARVAAALTAAGVPHEILNAVHHSREAAIISGAGQLGAVTVATNMAGRGTDIKLGPGVRERGGLLVILTERYTSARVDRQLHGRSGRQGDPGAVIECIALSDTLLKTRPRWVKGLLRLCYAVPGVGGRIAFALVSLLQGLTTRDEAKQRRRMVKSNRQFVDMISYKGREN